MQHKYAPHHEERTTALLRLRVLLLIECRRRYANTVARLAHIGFMSRLSGPRSLLSVLLGINGQHSWGAA